MKYTRIAVGVVAAVLLSVQTPALGAQADDLAAIRSDISTLRHDYEAKIKDLEARLKTAEAEAKAAKASATAAAAAANSSAAAAQKTVAVAQAVPATPPAASSAPAPRAPASANAFNPAIAAVLNGFFVATLRDPNNARILGFALGDEAGLPSRGFNIGESEIALSANIDPFLKGSLNLSFDQQNNIHVEEAYIQTANLGDGFTLKAGRFFSAIGYINERHSHDWSFSDAPLPYRAFLNNQYGDDGVQVRWLAPTDIFLEFGAEWYRGDAFPASGASNAGKGTETAFVHSGSDINESSSWLAALSYLHTHADGRETGHDIFTGTDGTGILSLVYKWAPAGNPTVQNLVLSGEFFYGKENGVFDAVPVDYNRWGWYAQGVYQFMPQWSFGLRYAELGSDGVGHALVGSTLDPQSHNPRAETALLEYDTSEFGRFRVQYTHDEAGFKPNDEVLFQYTVIYGPHGAHRY